MSEELPNASTTQPWPSISTGKEVPLPQAASRGKCQTSEGKKKKSERENTKHEE